MVGENHEVYKVLVDLVPFVENAIRRCLNVLDSAVKREGLGDRTQLFG